MLPTPLYSFLPPLCSLLPPSLCSLPPSLCFLLLYAPPLFMLPTLYTPSSSLFMLPTPLYSFFLLSQIRGLGIALKILFNSDIHTEIESPTLPFKLLRGEIVSFVNSFGRLNQLIAMFCLII